MNGCQEFYELLLRYYPICEKLGHPPNSSFKFHVVINMQNLAMLGPSITFFIQKVQFFKMRVPCCVLLGTKPGGHVVM